MNCAAPLADLQGSGEGVVPSVPALAFSAASWSLGGVDPNDFFSFTVAPAPGVTMSLTRLDLDERRSVSRLQ